MNFKNPPKKSLTFFQRINLEQFQKTKVSNLFPIFNVALIINLSLIAIAIGVIIGHLITKFA